MYRSATLGAAALAMAAFAPQAPAEAQSTVRTLDDNAITVSAPRPRPERGSVKDVTPPLELVSQVRVQTGDLNLHTPAGRAVLDDRLWLAANQVCAQLERLAPSTGLGDTVAYDRNCRNRAYTDARWQVSAVGRAG